MNHLFNWLKTPIIKFIFIGGSNTIVTTAIMALLTFIVSPIVAYSIAFVLGLAIAIFMNTTFVFGAKLSRVIALMLLCVYLFVFLLGVTITTLLTHFPIPKYWTSSTVLVTAPISFLLTRAVIYRFEPSKER
ncbi:GtrA family protein [Aurantimicrobium minutum]|uniref:GtrA family protein n=1 Tax=Aurantimicrobium minutum TaxID=708131 RepID=UPI002476A2D4|nr:GtrA family protein [Aurantimicrobium minutum]MDH6239034.1 putative flippase GtrA [Aurantimicrobium minutum]